MFDEHHGTINEYLAKSKNTIQRSVKCTEKSINSTEQSMNTMEKSLNTKGISMKTMEKSLADGVLEKAVSSKSEAPAPCRTIILFQSHVLHLQKQKVWAV